MTFTATSSGAKRNGWASTASASSRSARASTRTCGWVRRTAIAGSGQPAVAVRCCGGLVGNMYLEDEEVKRAEVAIIRRAIAHVRKKKKPRREETMREVRRRIKADAKLEPNYADAIADARTLGFGCHGYKPRRLICRLLGFHVWVRAYRTMSGDGSWYVSAECCPIHGCFYPKERGARIPLVPVAKPKQPSLWSPGDSAFWLDPELWDRTPMVAGRPDICWMHLDANFSRPRRCRHEMHGKPQRDAEPRMLRR
jgi:hypothetical protein